MAVRTRARMKAIQAVPVTVPAGNETDVRMAILNSLLTCPHRKLNEVYPVHVDLAQRDPIFYRHLAAWYADTGEIRDHQEAFIVTLILSGFEGHRDIGLALLRDLPPYRVRRIVDFISGTKNTKKIFEPLTKDQLKQLSDARKAQKKAAKDKAEVPALPVFERKATEEVESIGLFRSLPDSMRTEIGRWLREREADEEWFDGCVLSARQAMKRLYAKVQLKPSKRAQKILFENEMPSGSRLAALRELANAKTPADQAAVVIKNKIPFRVAQNVVSVMTPTVLLALIEVMTDQELVGSIGMLQKRGAMANADLKALIERRLEKAQKSKKGISALKTGVAVKVTGGAMKEQLEKLGDAQVKKKGGIKVPCALFVDISASMHEAIEVGKQIGAMIAGTTQSDFWTFAFNTIPYEIKATDATMSSWEKAFHGLRPVGGTACGCPFRALGERKVDLIVVIGDGGDNTAPQFQEGYAEYTRKTGLKPSVVLVHVPGESNVMTANCKRAGIEMETWEFNGDYYSLPGLLPLISKNSKLDLLLSILEWELPKRRPSLEEEAVLAGAKV